MSHILKLDREKCIGSATCQAVAQKFWMLDKDGKINLLQGVKNADNSEQTLEIDSKDFKSAMESAQACPVNAIHVINKKTSEKLI
ncbi:MAG TPA: ferredoxin [Candidatus Nanoarchaeia archaeon]|nr:ferredoxin [Candidatus Nanoarchaeia archaeon]